MSELDRLFERGYADAYYFFIPYVKDECDPGDSEKRKLAFKMVREACFHRDRTRFHDLRRNKNDLPKKDGVYEIRYINPINEFVYPSFETFQDGRWQMPIGVPVIAWREVENIEENVEL